MQKRYEELTKDARKTFPYEQETKRQFGEEDDVGRI
jgi:hypothetical protein